ncbi:MAG: hypothetical protein ACP5CD_04510, partial [Thermovirgaceae bacterium]
QYLTPCFARGPERFFYVFLSRLLGHIAALFVRHLTSHPDPGTFHPEGERHPSRKALLWFIREDFAVRKLRIEAEEIAAILEDRSLLATPKTAQWLHRYVTENIKTLRSGRE